MARAWPSWRKASPARSMAIARASLPAGPTNWSPPACRRIWRVRSLADLAAAPALIRIAETAKCATVGVARIYFAIGARLGFDWLRTAAGRVKAETSWQKRALTAIIDDLDGLQAELAARVIRAAGGVEGVQRVADSWLESHRAGLHRLEGLLTEMKMASVIDVAALTVALRELRALAA
jgi:glutamate dehydrogenase